MEGISLAMLLASWTTAVLWGSNAILFFVVARQLLGPVKQGRLLPLFSILLLLISMSTVHAILYLADVIKGFSLADSAMYFDSPRRLFMAETAIYLISCEIGDIFLTWRVYVCWDRRKIFAAPLLTLNMTSAVVAFVSLSRTRKYGAMNPDTVASGRAALALFLAAQCCGLLLLMWRHISTPTVFVDDHSSRWSLSSVLGLVVESGSLCTVPVFLTLVLSICDNQAIMQYFVGIDGQLAAFASLLITVRALWNRDQEEDTARIGIPPSTFLIRDRGTSVERISLDSAPRSPASGAGMVVNVRTAKRTFGDLDVSDERDEAGKPKA